MRKYIIGCIIGLMFMLESIFVELMPHEPFHHQWILVPRFLFISILFFAIYGNRNIGIIYGFVFGILFDIVYTEILGIYFFAFPLVIYICSKIMKHFQNNVVVVTVLSLLGVALLEIAVYWIIFLINLTTMTFIDFVNIRLLPTIVLNLIFTLIISYPYKLYFEKYAAESRE